MLHTANTTLNIEKIVKYFDPSFELLCDSPLLVELPNMPFDVACQKAKKPYPVSMELSLPEAPNETWINGTENKVGISLRSLRIRIVRTDTN